MVDRRPRYSGDGDGAADGEQNGEAGGGVEVKESVAGKDRVNESQGENREA